MGKIKIILWNIYNEMVNFVSPRDKSIVLMGAWFGNRFADNTRFLYQYLADHKLELGLTHVVWVTRTEKVQKELSEMGYEAYMMDSPESLYYHKKAGIHMICNSDTCAFGKNGDILVQYSNGAFKINLWHGLGGIKGVSFASKEYLELKKNHPIKCGIREWLRGRKLFRKYVQLLGGWADSYYLSTTPTETEIFQQYFQLPKDRFIESGYPRNEKNIRLRSCEKDVINKIKNSKRVALYMPTFRESNANYTAPSTDPAFISMLEKNEWLWIEKKHGADSSNLLNVVGSDAILQLDPDFDANVILPYIDLVVTDYSSVSWDALYHKKPVVFYMPDYEYYMNQDRGFVLKPEEFIIGPAVYDIEQLRDLFIENQEDLSKMLPENAEEIFVRFWGEEKTCAQIWEDIKRVMEKKS